MSKRETVSGNWCWPCVKSHSFSIGLFSLIILMTKSRYPNSYTHGQKVSWSPLTFSGLTSYVLFPLAHSLSPLSSVLLSSQRSFRRFTFHAFTKSACTSVKWGNESLPFLWPPVALQHEREGWGLEVAVTSFLVCATCSKFATKCLSSVELTGEKWALSEPWPGCHEMTGIIGIHFKQPCAILLKCHIPTLKQTRRNPLW